MRKTHCKRGHAMTPENTYVYEFTRVGSDKVTYTQRVCKECGREREAAKKRHPVNQDAQ